MNLTYDMWRRLMLMDHNKSTPKMYGKFVNGLRVKRRGGSRRK